MARIDPVVRFVVATCELVLRPLSVPMASEVMARVALAVGPRVLKPHIMRRNFAAAFPELREEELDGLVRRAIANFGRLLGEVAHMKAFRDGRRGAELRLHGEAPAPLGPEGNAVFVGAHLGNWEVVPIILAHLGHRVTIVQTPIGEPMIDARMMAKRQATGATYVEKRHALKPCASTLKRGGSLALLVDSRVEQGVEATFFGQRATFTPLPARMARRFDCPIVVVDSWRSRPGCISISFSDPIHPGEFTGRGGLEAMTQRMVTAMEQTIRRHPDQWFCNKRRLTGPDGDARTGDSGTSDRETSADPGAVVDSGPSPSEALITQRG